MKGLVAYLAAGAIGAAAGTVGVGSYQALVVGIAPDSTLVADSTHATEQGEEEAAGESSTTVAQGGEAGSVLEPEVPDQVETGTEAVDSAGAPTVVASTGGEAPVEAAPQAAPDASEAEAQARAQQNYPRLARIFAAMKPEEAAPVLAQLDDEQLEGILLAMQGRNAAPILAEMDPERAAAISRRVLGGNR